jgi:hypothetical protein
MSNEDKDVCRVCGNDSIYLFQGRILKDNRINYFECTSCEYVQTEHPYWLEEAYAEPINQTDTGILLRNQNNAKYVLSTLLTLGLPKSSIVDYAGGYGILVRLLRDYGVDAFWMDLYTQNIFSKGFEYSSINEHKPIKLTTAFEVFEHLVYPSAELDKLFSVSPNVLFSTSLINKPAPSQSSWYYYGKDHGQHIGFFRAKTLSYLAKKHNKYLVSDGKSLHLFSENPVNIHFWRNLVRVKIITPLIFKLFLKSKTIDDYQKLLSN